LLGRGIRWRQRAQILIASMVYTPVNQIALICQTDQAYVRRVMTRVQCPRPKKRLVDKVMGNRVCVPPKANRHHGNRRTRDQQRAMR